jgi:predicted outer membrane repeat protein
VRAKTISVTPGQSIQAAIDAAENGDTIYIAAGVYTGSLTISKTLNLLGAGRDQVTLLPSPFQRVMTVTGQSITPLISGIRLSCGLATLEPVAIEGPCSAVHPRIESAVAARPSVALNPASRRVMIDLPDDNAYPVERALSPFQGYEDFVPEAMMKCRRQCGGAIAILDGADPTLDAIDIVLNASNYDPWPSFGGGVFVDNKSTLKISNALLQNNMAWVGGGLSAYGNIRVEQSVFRDNIGDSGAGALNAYRDLSALVVQDSVFENNYTRQSGGAINAYNVPNITIARNIFRKNMGTGGIVRVLTRGPIAINGNIFYDNANGYTGQPGAIDTDLGDVSIEFFTDYSTVPLYVDIVGNTFNRSNTPSAIALNDVFDLGNRVLVRDNIFTNYRVGVVRGQGSHNLVMDNNLIGPSVLTPTHFHGRYPKKGTDVVTLTRTIYADPLLAADGYHLLPNSPAIDAGTASPPSTDIDGQYRPQRGASDIGADEFYDAVPLSGLSAPCPATSSGLTLIPASIAPVTASGPISYTVFEGAMPIYSQMGSGSATLAIPWQIAGAKQLTITASNGLGSASVPCAINVTGPAKRQYLPVARH